MAPAILVFSHILKFFSEFWQEKFTYHLSTGMLVLCKFE